MSSPSPSKKFLKLYASCIPVKGARRTAIVDTQRHAYYFAPNDVHALLGATHCIEIAAALRAYPTQHALVQQYLDYLLHHELGFLTDEPERFPIVDLAYRTPEAITNAMVDVDAASDFDFAQLATQLDALKCKALQVRFNYPRTCAELTLLLAAFGQSVLRGIEVYVPHDGTYDAESLAQLAREVPRLNVLHLHGAESNKIDWYRRLDLRVVYVQESLHFPSCCGVVQPSYFTHNLGHVAEATNYNSCLNRKIALDARGNIKNCPSMPQAYGNIKANTLAEALRHPDFTQAWDITKSRVKVCQDCEFRLVCTDCRAYVEDPTDAFSKPLKCGYDPYTAQWQEWSTNPLKQAAIGHYGLSALVPDAAAPAA